MLLLGKHLSPAQAKSILALFYKLPISFIEDSAALSEQTYILAAKAGVAYYDASFLALAQQLDGTLITDNIKRQGKPQGIRVKAVEDY